MSDRPTITVESPIGGWPQPWPNVAEIEQAFPHTNWTLVGGLMTQLHAIHKGIDALRATNDVDMVLHVETSPGVAAEAVRQLESLGYALVAPLNDRDGSAHRFQRGPSTVELSSVRRDTVDTLVADHAPPRTAQTLRGYAMVAIEGGTQALRRTVNARLGILQDRTTVISVPGAFGAVVLKAAAYRVDLRDRERHLQDAVLLLAAMDDPYAEREGMGGSDRSRLLTLARALPEGSRLWNTLPEPSATNAQAALRILLAQ